MDIFQCIQKHGLEQLILCHDESVGLRGIIALHNTLLGPALGGVRMRAYPDQYAAIMDAVALAREMTYRAALADCDLGGGSVVLWGSPEIDKSEAYFRALGRFLERLSAQLFVTVEVGTDGHDTHDIERETDNVLALPEEYGGMADPTEMTADGAFQGLRATARELNGKSSLDGVSCLVQGLGRVGTALVERLAGAGAKLVITDLNYDRIKNIQDRHPDVTMVRPEDAVDVRCDIFVPCAAVPHEESVIGRLKCRAISGPSAFTRADLDAAEKLAEREILFVPNFVIDAGGTIQASAELKGLSLTRLELSVEGIYRRTRNLLEEAKRTGDTPFSTALKLAQKRLTSIGNIGRHNAW